MELGRIAYEAYKQHSRGKSLVSGANLPEWEDQAKEIKAAWNNAASAAVEAHLDSLDKGL